MHEGHTLKELREGNSYSVHCVECWEHLYWLTDSFEFFHENLTYDDYNRLADIFIAGTAGAD